MKNLLALAFIFVCGCSVFGGDCATRAKETKPQLATETRKTYELKLAQAFEDHDRSRGSADAVIWLGRRIAYLGNYKDAIRIFTSGIAKYPNDARLYRHRGHRYITLRCFDEAIRDLQTAAELVGRKPDEIEPDGLPNARNIPTSTLQTNIWYHLGLAYYLKGDWNMAAAKFMHSYNLARSLTNSDMKVASVYWAYMSAARYGKLQRKDADRLLSTEMKDDLDIIENHDYYKLIKLNKGLLNVEDLLKDVGGEADSLGSASLGYGIGNYFLYNGDKRRAMALFRKIVEGNQWASFGYIAAEAELSREPIE